MTEYIKLNIPFRDCRIAASANISFRGNNRRTNPRPVTPNLKTVISLNLFIRTGINNDEISIDDPLKDNIIPYPLESNFR
nr:hypothetical protein [Thermosediminibacter litoriperuensis]